MMSSNTTRVSIVDYGMSNLQSVVHALQLAGAQVDIVADPENLQNPTHIIIPGVGSFAQASRCLHEKSWPEALEKTITETNAAVLGICLGMQLLADEGTEGGATKGLGLIPGRIVKLPIQSPLRIPHIGWNDVAVRTGHPQSEILFAGIPSPSDFYFVHSYVFLPDSEEHILSTTHHGRDFASSVMAGRILGTQFHPEKSSKAGFKLLQNFLLL